MINTSAIKAPILLPDSMTLLIHSHPINLEHQTYVYNPSSCPTVFQHLFPAIARFITVLVVIKADVFMPEHIVQFWYPIISMTRFTNFQMIPSSKRHQRMYIYSWPYRPFLHIRALQKPRKIKVFSPHCGSLILVYTLRTFRHKQDSVLVRRITTTYSISMLYLPPFDHNI